MMQSSGGIILASYLISQLSPKQLEAMKLTEQDKK